MAITAYICFHFLAEEQKDSFSGRVALVLLKSAPAVLLARRSIKSEGTAGVPFNRLVCAGLVFCAFGDAFLQIKTGFELEKFFLLGLVSFLLGHILFIQAINKVSQKPPPKWLTYFLV